MIVSMSYILRMRSDDFSLSDVLTWTTSNFCETLENAIVDGERFPDYLLQSRSQKCANLLSL